MQSQDTPRKSVRWTTELLELMLLQLDMQTLLLAQRTCRLWHAVINTSSSIQKLLFYLPSENENPLYNPLLANSFPAFFPHPTTGMTDANCTCMTFEAIQNPDKITAYNRRESSWRRMLVRQPPLLNFVFLETDSGNAHNRRFNRKIIQPRDRAFAPSNQGLRMEVLYQFVVTGGSLKFEADHYHRLYWSNGASLPMVSHPWRGRSEVIEALQQTLAQADLVIHSRRPFIIRRSMPKSEMMIEEKRRRLIVPDYVSSAGDVRLYNIINWEI